MGSDAHQLGAKSPPDLPSYRLHKTGFRNKPESSTCNSHRFTNLVLSSRHAMPESKLFFLHTECGASSQICLKFNRFVWSVLVGALKPNFGLIPLESESANVPKCAQGHGVPTFRIANVRHVPESCLVEAVRFRKVRHKCPTWTFLAFSPRPRRARACLVRCITTQHVPAVFLPVAVPFPSFGREGGREGGRERRRERE